MPPTTPQRLAYTDHARERMQQRRITEAMISQTIAQPDDREREADDDTKFTRTLRGRKVQVIAHWLPDERKWLIKSVWVRGEDDPLTLWQMIVRFVRRLLKL